MIESDQRSLVSTAWLADHLESPDVRIVDGSWYLPQMSRDAKAEYQAGHIPGAVFFDIDEIADTDSPYPHMLPSPEKFASRVRKLGLGDGNRIVVYDGSGVNLSAARVWWMFRVFGAREVAVLDGGWRKWQAEGRPVEDRLPYPRERHFTARFDHRLVRHFDQMLANLANQTEQVLDARSAGRFKGIEPEPRAGLKSGHIPGSRNLPFGDLVDAAGCLWPAAKLKEKFAAAGVDLAKPIVTSCGSGVSACALALALDFLGCHNVAIYDGSWSEWGARPEVRADIG